MSVTSLSPTQVIYPDSDGKPMADNTLQFEYIVVIKEGLEALFADDTAVFVAGDLLWYPLEGENRVCAAPDVMVAFGRPKGHRGSYKQFEEDGIAPQVVFEILSPGNRTGEMTSKAIFYDRYGVEEYYIFDPDNAEFTVVLRSSETGRLELIQPDVSGFWVSPRLGIRFELSEGALKIYRPDGERFKTYTEMMAERNAERVRAEQAEARVELLTARLRELGIDPDSVTTPP